MNRLEAEIFESVFVPRGFHVHIHPDLDPLRMLRNFEKLDMLTGLERAAMKIILNAEDEERKSENEAKLN